MQAGFAEVDITPALGTRKIGWLMEIISDRVLDPLHARAAVFRAEKEDAAFIQLDTLSIRWTQVQEIRQRIQDSYGFPGGRVMVAATHNHAGPAVAHCGDSKRDDAYIESLVDKCVGVFGSALGKLQDAELGFSHVFEFNVAHNRRVVMRGGTVRTHGSFADPDALYLEGPIDPEVAVLAARRKGGKLAGCIVNFSCHPTHHGATTDLSAGYPGVLAREMRSKGCPITLFLNGASGNTHTTDPVTQQDVPMEEAGRRLAEDALRAIGQMKFTRAMEVGGSQTTVHLHYREATPEQVAGTARGAQRFIDPAIYDRSMPSLLQRIELRRSQPAEVQALFVGPLAVVGVPAEYFVEHGLRIKEKTYPRHTLVAGQANGMVGYVPTRQAFEHGGYETTFAPSSRMAPDAGDVLADAAIDLVNAHSREASLPPRKAVL